MGAIWAGADPEVSRYRVDYRATGGDGSLIVCADEDTLAGLVEHAQSLLEQAGIEGHIRRLVPLNQGPGRGTGAIPPRIGHRRRQP